MSRPFILNNLQLNRFIILLSAVVSIFMFKYRFSGQSGNEYKDVISGDGKGYYAYLPAVFIYHDLTFSFFDKDPEKFGYQYSNTFLLNQDKKNLNKYTCGEAILLLPFFLMGILYSWFMGWSVDGYNGAFHVFCALGNLFYFISGLLITKKVLRWYNLSNTAIAASLLAITLGSNMLNYVVYESSMSHVFSFFIIALHVYTAKRFFDSPSLKIILLGGLTLGLIVLIRPINGVIVFAYPFLAAEKNFFALLKSNLKYFLAAGAVAGSIIFIQLIFWKLETGNFLVYGYKNEGFYFDRMPPVFNYLFSFKRGAFIYSPVLLFAFIGLWKMRREKAQVLWLLFFLLLVVYVHASWWSWYYGDGFGERPLIDFYIFFALLLAFVFEKISKKIIRITYWSLLIVFTLLHQVFFYQFIKGIIHPYSMDFEKFSYVFLKTSDRYRYLYKCETEDFYHPRGVFVSDSLFYSLTDTNFVFPKNFYIVKKNIRQGAYYEATDIYPFNYEIITDKSWLFKTRFAEIGFDYMQPLPDSAAAKMTDYVTMFSTDNTISYYNNNPFVGRAFNTPMQWNHSFERLKIGIPEKTGLYIRIFIDNMKKKKLFIKNLSIKIVEANP
ncbi:MAG TPA: hypothetical protein VNZ49_07455 [Bacteroidia bacterium]|nr:hypothetical protein [Bacteroidia bacterium]